MILMIKDLNSTTSESLTHPAASGGNNLNINVIDALLLWKKNVEKHFEGVEECPMYVLVWVLSGWLPLGVDIRF